MNIVLMAPIAECRHTVVKRRVSDIHSSVTQRIVKSANSANPALLAPAVPIALLAECRNTVC